MTLRMIVHSMARARLPAVMPSRAGMSFFHRHIVQGLVAALLWSPLAALAADCTVNTSGAAIAFGVYDPLSATPVPGVGTLVVDCAPPNANNLAVTFSLSTGGSGSYFPRRMTSGAATLDYNLYTSSANTTVFGNGGSGTQTVVRSTSSTGGANFRASAQVFGTMPAGQNAAFGNYSDTIQVTVTF